MINPYVGEVTCFGFDWAPQGWIKCEGQLLSVQKFNQLFSVVGTAFGGDGKTTFALPNVTELPAGLQGFICQLGGYPTPPQARLSFASSNRTLKNRKPKACAVGL